MKRGRKEEREEFEREVCVGDQQNLLQGLSDSFEQLPLMSHFFLLFDSLFISSSAHSYRALLFAIIFKQNKTKHTFLLSFFLLTIRVASDTKSDTKRHLVLICAHLFISAYGQWSPLYFTDWPVSSHVTEDVHSILSVLV